MTTPEVTEAEMEAELERQKAIQAAEWGRYVCGPAAIYVGGARAFNPGDSVPVSHVESGAVDVSQVVERPATAGEVPVPEIPAAVEEN